MTQAEEREKLVAAIRAETLEAYPVETISKGVWVSRNPLGETPLHCAAIYGQLSKIPAKYVTKENISLKDKSGQSVFGYAAVHNYLRQLPQELITEELLLDSCSKQKFDKYTIKFTNLHALVNLNQLDQILGIPLSGKCERIVGREWLAKNNSVIQAKKGITEEANQEQEVEIF